jgi:hypothetical protein
MTVMSHPISFPSGKAEGIRFIVKLNKVMTFVKLVVSLFCNYPETNYENDKYNYI